MSTSTKSNNGRIEWIVSQGRLKEIGPSSTMFEMAAIDTKKLKDLLCSCSDEIDQAAEKELQGIHQSQGSPLQEESRY